ncbi:MAG: ATP-binding cassette domain-containing protein [Nitrososphaerota archaeon]|nr:ATP-binding cassette domain-containing protein [Candidatus Bathyarchaeota archaeon]MDW8061665.1 ATP-binding cassette domain-containing protein [Nitrososphaerota archaeon]
MYGRLEILRGVCLEVREGDFISIRGKSGVGKTTLLKLLGLLEEPDRGRVIVFGRDYESLSDRERSDIRLHRIGFVYQFFNLIASLTVLENVELPLALAGVGRGERRARAIELLDRFDLTHLAYRMPSTLSGGEKQRIAIVRALANNPKLILADEPTSSLDEENTRLVLNLLEDANRMGAAIVITTTDLSERIPSDRDYVLRDGTLKSIG